ncbi:MAG TPA: adenosylcobinamide-GDP ribazoletransferase [Dehalococcoidales bacterium]|nr:adenosylcobinamide-GDP ribazoletransferase [Dehalococcoidales bacterium]
MSFLAALQFLTSVPVPGTQKASPEQLGRATAWFPAVGLIIGLVLAGLNWVLGLVLPAAVVNALLIAALVVITGALHLDGFVDTCDGIAGHMTVEERWNVMRDSRAGAFGIIGVVLLLLVKYAALNAVPPALMAVTLIFLPVVSRWAMVYAVFAYPYARPEGLGTAYKRATRWPQFTAATAIMLAAAAALYPFFWLTGFFIIGGAWVITTLLCIYLKRKLAGLTGDTYGAVNEVAEVAMLLLAVLVFNNIGAA